MSNLTRKDMTGQESKCSLERCHAIAGRNNVQHIKSGGFAGSFEMMEQINDPKDWKRKAAHAIIGHIECVKANREGFNRVYKGSFWLDKARIYRKKAMELSSGV